MSGVMPFIARVIALAALALVAWLVVAVGRKYVAGRRKQALLAEPLALAGADGERADVVGRVRVLAFSSDDCVQCHRMQAPALARVQEARPNTVAVEEIDAPSSPELASRYHVLTVPTTIVLDATGRAHAVNYGFASASKLLEQVDVVAAMSAAADRTELQRQTLS